MHRSDSLKASQAPSLRAAITTDSSNVETLLKLSLDLSEVFVLSGLLKLSPVELRMRMEQGGTVKQGLRLGSHNMLYSLVPRLHPLSSLRKLGGECVEPGDEATCCTHRVIYMIPVYSHDSIQFLIDKVL